MEISNNNRRIAKNAVFLYIRTFVVMLVSLFTSRITLQALGETDYGVYNVVGGIVVLFAFLNTSMQAATQRFLNFEMGRGDIERVRHIFNISVLAHASITAAVLLLGETVGLWFLNEKLNIPSDRMVAAQWVYQFSVIGCCAQIMRIPHSASVIAYERMSFFAYASIVENVLRLIIAYAILVWAGDRLEFYGLLMLFSIVATNVLYHIYCRSQFPTCRYRWEWDKRSYMQLMSFSGWSMVGAGANVVANQGRSFIFNIFCGVLVNTALGIVHQMTLAVNSFYSSFQTAFSPQIVKNYAAQQKEQLYALIYRSTRISFFLAILVALPLIAYAEPVIRLWLGQVPEYTVPFARMFIVSTIIESLSMPLWTTVQATGNIRTYQITMATITVLTLPVAYILLQMGFSPVYAVLAKVVADVVIYLFRLAFVHRLAGLNLTEYAVQVSRTVVIVGLLSCIVPMLCLYYLCGTAGTFAGITLTIVSCVVIIFMIGLHDNERRLLTEKIKEIISR